MVVSHPKKGVFNVVYILKSVEVDGWQDTRVLFVGNAEGKK